MKKRVLAAVLTSAMVISSLTGCGSSSSQTSSDSKASTESSGAIRFVNTKIEIDKPLKEFAKKYQEKTRKQVPALSAFPVEMKRPPSLLL